LNPTSHPPPLFLTERLLLPAAGFSPAITVVQSADGLLYVDGVDTLMPCIPHAGHLPHGFTDLGALQFRPELVRSYRNPTQRSGRTPLSPLPTGAAIGELKAAMRVLGEVAVPQCARIIDELTSRPHVSEVVVLRRIPFLAHWQGVNLRYLPHVMLRCQRSTARQLIAIEMLARTIKRLLRAACSSSDLQPDVAPTHDAPTAAPSSALIDPQAAIRQAVADIVSTIFMGPTPTERSTFWLSTVLPCLRKQFPLLQLQPPGPESSDSSGAARMSEGGVLSSLQHATESLHTAQTERYAELLEAHVRLTMQDDAHLAVLYARLTDIAFFTVDSPHTGACAKPSADGTTDISALTTPAPVLPMPTQAITPGQIRLGSRCHSSLLAQAALTSAVAYAAEHAFDFPPDIARVIAGQRSAGTPPSVPCWQGVAALAQEGLFGYPSSMWLLYLQGTSFWATAKASLSQSKPGPNSTSETSSTEPPHHPSADTSTVGALLRQATTTLRTAVRYFPLFQAALARLADVLRASARLLATPTTGEADSKAAVASEQRRDFLTQAVALVGAVPQPTRRVILASAKGMVDLAALTGEWQLEQQAQEKLDSVCARCVCIREDTVFRLVGMQLLAGDGILPHDGRATLVSWADSLAAAAVTTDNATEQQRLWNKAAAMIQRAIQICPGATASNRLQIQADAIMKKN